MNAINPIHKTLLPILKTVSGNRRLRIVLALGKLRA
jgi:hypothetical protein